jgi:type IV secretory pathway TrbD component
MLSPIVVGIVAGLVIGVAFVWFGALDAFFVGLFMLAGWIVAKLYSGDIDFLDLYERFMASRGKRPRA